MTFSGALDLLPMIGGVVLVLALLGLHVARFDRRLAAYHGFTVAWWLSLVVSDLVHIEVHEHHLHGWGWSALFYSCLVLFVVSQVYVHRMSLGSWPAFVLDAWIVGSVMVLVTWAIAGLDGAAPGPSLMDVTHIAVTGWLLLCTVRYAIDNGSRSILWQWYGFIVLRAVAVVALLAHHETALVDLGHVSSVLLPLSYLMALPTIRINASRRPETGRRAIIWQANNLPFIVAIAAAPLVMVGFTAGDNANDPLYLTLAGSIGVSLCLRTMLAAGQNRRLVEQLTERSEQLYALAYRDPLTGLANRNRFVGRLSSVMERAGSDPSAGGPHVLFIDLDGFKQVNDASGHAAGDAVLCDVAARLRQATPPDAFLGRIGGDEFVALVEDVTLREAERIAGDVVDAVSVAYVIDHGSFVIGASVGIAAASDAADADDLLRHGDLAMYTAKRDRLPSAIYAERMHEAAVRKADDDRMYSAVLNEQRLELRYQPLVDLTDERIVGCEALLRWRTPDGEWRAPGGLLEFALRSGQLVDLSQWTIGRALSQAEALRERFGRVPVSVNLAPVELLRPGLVSMVCDELAIHELPPEALVLEITEQALIEEPDRVIRVLADLRAQQIRIAIDDFGTGFSSLAYLVDLPVDSIKLDQSFVHSLPRHAPARTVVAGVIRIAEQLGLELIAEGVESAEQAALLAGLGCRYCQGSHFYAPMPDAGLTDVTTDASDDISPGR